MIAGTKYDIKKGTVYSLTDDQCELRSEHGKHRVMVILLTSGDRVSIAKTDIQPTGQ